MGYKYYQYREALSQSLSLVDSPIVSDRVEIKHLEYRTTMESLMYSRGFNIIGQSFIRTLVQ